MLIVEFSTKKKIIKREREKERQIEKLWTIGQTIHPSLTNRKRTRKGIFLFIQTPTFTEK